MGFGDVKLAGVLGMVLGLVRLGRALVGAFLGFLLGGVVGVALIVCRLGTRKTMIPFGPYMLLGTWLALGLGRATWPTCTSTTVGLALTAAAPHGVTEPTPGAPTAHEAQGRPSPGRSLASERPHGHGRVAAAEGDAPWQHEPPSVSTSGPRASAPPSCRSAGTA